MKTQISKLFFVFGATLFYLGLFSPLNAQAQQTQFNTLSNDKPTVRVSNHTNNPGCTNCWSESVSADPGDIVAVYIYYHNTGTATANSTTLKLNSAGTGFNSTHHTISGSVGATNANTVNGSVTINLSQSESLVFDNYLKWYPNHQITNPSTIPFGQSINSILTSSGINIGNIAPDSPLGSFSTQGSVVVHFRVSDNYVPPPQQVNCVIDDFTASPSVINYGYYSTLNWNTTNCDNLIITGGSQTFSGIGQDGSVSTGTLNSTRTYTIKGYGDNGLVQKSVTVTVTGQPSDDCEIDSFYASPDEIDEGDDSTLHWSTTNCSSAYISNGIGNVSTDGNEDVDNLTEDETYTLTAYGYNSSDTMTITIQVNDDNNNNDDDCEIDSFYASPDEVEEGDDSTIYWETSNCTDVDISNGVGDVSNDGDEEINNIQDDETFTITATGNNGSSDSETITIEVDEDSNDNDDDQCEVNDFYASPSSVTYGGSVRLYWETTDADDIYISSVGYQSDDDGDYRINNIYATTTYTISVYCNGDSDTDSVTVYVNQQPVSETLAVTTVGASNIGRTSATLVGAIAHTGSSSASAGFEYWMVTATGGGPKLVTDQTPFYGTANSGFTKNISGLLSDTTYMYRAYATGSIGTIYGETKSFRTLQASAPVNTNTVIYVNSGTGESLLDLDITSAFENVGVGEQYDIDIAYENTSGTVTARDTTLTIVLPKNLVFQRISRGEYNLKDHTIFVDLEDVSPKEKGEITLQVVVGPRAENGELLVTIGTLNYEKNSVKEEVIDILTNKVTADGSVLGAFALGGGFWPNTLIGWLILLIVFLMIVYIANKMFRRKNVAQPMAVPVPPQTYR